jgi:hypothetical protein
MHLFTTILFVDGNPVKYEVHRSGQVFRLHPTDNPNEVIEPPVIQARREKGEWNVAGTADQDLVAKVVEDMNRNSGSLVSLN